MHLFAINIYNFDHSKNGVFTKKPGTLTNDYFVNLLDMNTTWKETDKSEQKFVGTTRKTKKSKWVLLESKPNKGFYKLPKPIQNTIKRVAYDYSNKKMNDTSFIVEKN